MGQHQISIYWLLLVVKSELTSLSDFSCSEVMLLDWASRFATGLPEAMHLLIILQPTIESSLWWLFVVITFPSQILNQIALYGRFLFPPNIKSFSLKTWVICRFDQVIPTLFLVSRILAQSTKIWRHCIIASLHCTIPYASSHKHQLTSAIVTLSKSADLQYPLDCIRDNLVATPWFRGSLLNGYILEAASNFFRFIL